MKKAGRPDAAPPGSGNRRTAALRGVLAAALLLGALFVFIGVARGEVLVILAKATSICYQCIGIG